eukprot:TRINITY_DN5292_c0_g1_i7.p1 TRINITY_DN5292_c0_g1~~TRINITY_DN5292_c0_g1_i7.p1  ORF type:complete len:193 (+),score=26.43 TRINITY_DN5292_c0_g1_i7:1869-2447(+)
MCKTVNSNMTESNKRQKQLHELTDAHEQGNETMIRTSTLEAQLSIVTSKLHIESIRCGVDMENHERLVDVHLDVMRLNNNGIRNFSNSTVDTLLGNNLIDVQVQDGSNAISSIRSMDRSENNSSTNNIGILSHQSTSTGELTAMYNGVLVDNNLIDVQVHEGIVASNDRRSMHDSRQMPTHNKIAASRIPNI